MVWVFHYVAGMQKHWLLLPYQAGIVDWACAIKYDLVRGVSEWYSIFAAMFATETGQALNCVHGEYVSKLQIVNQQKNKEDYT